MATDDTQVALQRAFREITRSLIGLFDLYEADPRLIQHAAASLRRIYLVHLERVGPHSGADGKAALHDLLRELQSESGTPQD
jgi:hypothetical protein